MKQHVQATVCLVDDQPLSAETVCALSELAMAGASVLIGQDLAPDGEKSHSVEVVIRIAEDRKPEIIAEQWQ